MITEALKLALDALEADLDVMRKTIAAIKAALAAPVQEQAEQLAKLGWQAIECPFCGSSGAQAFPKPAAQRQWVGLTDDELDEAETEGGKSYKRWASRIRGQMLRQQDSLQWHVSRAIEAKLKEKNT